MNSRSCTKRIVQILGLSLFTRRAMASFDTAETGSTSSLGSATGSTTTSEMSVVDKVVDRPNTPKEVSKLTNIARSFEKLKAVPDSAPSVRTKRKSAKARRRERSTSVEKLGEREAPVFTKVKAVKPPTCSAPVNASAPPKATTRKHRKRSRKGRKSIEHPAFIKISKVKDWKFYDFSGVYERKPHPQTGYYYTRFVGRQRDMVIQWTPTDLKDSGREDENGEKIMIPVWQWAIRAVNSKAYTESEEDLALKGKKSATRILNMKDIKFGEPVVSSKPNCALTDSRFSWTASSTEQTNFFKLEEYASAEALELGEQRIQRRSRKWHLSPDRCLVFQCEEHPAFNGTYKFQENNVMETRPSGRTQWRQIYICEEKNSILKFSRGRWVLRSRNNRYPCYKTTDCHPNRGGFEYPRIDLYKGFTGYARVKHGNANWTYYQKKGEASLDSSVQVEASTPSEESGGSSEAALLPTIPENVAWENVTAAVEGQTWSDRSGVKTDEACIEKGHPTDGQSLL